MDIILTALGLYVILPFLANFFRLFNILHLQLSPTKSNPLAKYKSDNAWALVTGCTSGIGEAMAHKLA